MKKKKLLKTSSIVLVLALLISTLLSAFADTTGATTNDSTDRWILQAPMSNSRYAFQTIEMGGKIFAMGGTDGKTYLNTLEEYDPLTNVWTNKASMSMPRQAFQVVTLDEKIYVVGGMTNNGLATSSVEEYDPSTDKWTQKAAMNEAREYFTAVTLNGKIYSIGGGQGGASVEEYDPITNKWTRKASMSNSRQEHRAIVLNNKILVLGGANIQGTLTSVEEYDPETDKWSSKTPMAIARYAFETAVIDGMVYAIGGNETSSLEQYNPINDQWTTKSSMSVERKDFQAEVINGKIYAIGGRSSTSTEEYDPATDKWSLKPTLSVTRFWFRTESINGTIYAMGGGNNSLESYFVAQPFQSPTLTVTPSADKVTVGNQFNTTVAIHKGTNICAEDIKLAYDTTLFEYIGAEAQTGLKIQNEDSTTTPGTIRFIVSCLGKDNTATGDKDLITLKFKAKMPGQGKVDITKGRVADNATLEMDVADADCGEATITVESNKDVNRSGGVTLLDLGIDGWYYGSDAKDTDSTKYDADVMPNGKIDDEDLNEITQGILSNSKYPNN